MLICCILLTLRGSSNGLNTSREHRNHPTTFAMSSFTKLSLRCNKHTSSRWTKTSSSSTRVCSSTYKVYTDATISSRLNSSLVKEIQLAPSSKTAQSVPRRPPPRQRAFRRWTPTVTGRLSVQRVVTLLLTTRPLSNFSDP